VKQNYLSGEKGIQINDYMSATTWNLKKMMVKLKEKLLNFIFYLFLYKRKNMNLAYKVNC